MVWLPVAHAGGGLRLTDGVRESIIEASEEGLRWAAFADDVRHEVLPVERGHRVTLAFTLRLAGASREWDRERCAPLVAATNDERGFGTARSASCIRSSAPARCSR